MLIPLSWLREYVDIDIPVQELAHRLTMAGVEVGEVVELGGWKECFVGKVLEVRPNSTNRLGLVKPRPWAGKDIAKPTC